MADYPCSMPGTRAPGLGAVSLTTLPVGVPECFLIAWPGGSQLLRGHWQGLETFLVIKTEAVGAGTTGSRWVKTTG